VKIRIMCLPAEVTQAVAALQAAFEVIEVSEPRTNRGASRMVRVYVETSPLRTVETGMGLSGGRTASDRDRLPGQPGQPGQNEHETCQAAAEPEAG
jgi:hypothetical protein